MSKEKTKGMPDSLRVFLDSAPEGSREALMVLGAAYALTNELAVELIVDILNWPEDKAKQFVEALHVCDFVTER